MAGPRFVVFLAVVAASLRATVAQVPVSYGAYQYASLDRTAPWSSSTSCGNSWWSLPSGWEFCPDTGDSRYMTRAYPWGTHCMVYTNGIGIWASRWNAGADCWCNHPYWRSVDGGHCWLRSGNSGYVRSCSRRIMIRKSAGCNAGYYGNGASCTACPAGRYRTSIGGQSVNDCTLCSAGRYGSATGQTSLTAACPSLCSPGYYCPAGTTSWTQAACPAGRYNPSSGGGSIGNCADCPVGNYCPNNGMTSGTACPRGRYGPYTGRTASSQCPTCPAGSYCTGGQSSIPVCASGAAADQYYCPDGYNRYTVGAGYYASGGSSSRWQGQTLCQAGYYCSSGLRYSCPAGRYGSSSGLQSSSCNGPCRAGYWCPAGSTSNEQTACVNGRPNKAECDGATMKGVKCYCPSGTTSVLLVSTNYYTTPDDEARKYTREAQAACPAGRRCADGVLLPTLVWTDSCPAGFAVRTVLEGASNTPLLVPSDANQYPNQNKPIVADSYNEQAITYKIASVIKDASCALANPFTINTGTGELRLGASAIDYEPCPKYKINVDATDAAGAKITCEVTVNVGDVNEAPSIGTCVAREVEEGSALHTFIPPAMTASDPDLGQQLKFEIIAGNALNYFKISSCSGQIQVNSPPVYNPAASTITLTIRVSDDAASPLSAQCTTAIKILDRNDPPVVTAKSFTIDENRGVDAWVGDMDAKDPDDDAMTYRVSRPDTPDAFTVDSEGAVRVKAALLDFETKASYVFDVRVSDRPGDASYTDAKVTVTLRDTNDAPVVVTPLVNPSVPENSPVGKTFGAKIVATDQDRPAQALTFSVEGSTPFAIDNSGQLSVKTATLDHEASAQWTISVRATDSAGAFGVASLTVDVSDVNEAPSLAATAGTPRAVDENSLVGTSVNGVVVGVDPDTNAQQSLFYSLAAPSTLFAIDATSGVFKVAGALDYEATASHSYTLSVRVTDSGSPPLSATADMVIKLNDVNDAPVITNTVPLSVPENAANVAVGSVTIHDDDAGDTHTFLITYGNTDNVFSLGSTNGAVKTTSITADYEKRKEYGLKVQVTDSQGAVAIGVVDVAITDVNEKPEFVYEFKAEGGPGEPPVQQPLVRVTAEHAVQGSLVGSALLGNDPEGDAIQWSFQTCTTIFDITSTGQIKVKAAKLGSVSTNPSYSCKVRVTDGRNAALYTEDTVTIKLDDVNEPPVFSSPTYTISVAENAAIGTKVGSPISATDPDDGQTATLVYDLLLTVEAADSYFSIDSATGQISLLKAVDYETQAQYTLTVIVTDRPPKGLAMQATATVTVNILDINEAPTFDSSGFNRVIDENSPVNTNVGAPVPGSDQDEAGKQKLLYTIVAGNNGDAFKIDANTAQISVANNVINFEQAETYTLTIKATDPAGLSATASVAITVNDLNDPPVLGALPVAAVREDAAIGFVVGTLTATDQDKGSAVVFTITAGNSAGAVSLDGQTGIVTVAKPLDFETTNAYSFDVRVTDDAGAFVSATWRVTIIDINEAPVYTGPTRAFIDENRITGTSLATATGKDQDAGDTQKLTWAIVDGNTGDAFMISKLTGEISVKDPTRLNYEVLAALAPDMFSLDVECKDPGGLAGKGTIKVTVRDVNEPPSIPDKERGINEDVSGVGPWNIGTQLNVVDEDFGQSFTLEIVSGNDDGLFKMEGRQLLLLKNTPSLIDHETIPSYSIAIKVTDSGTPPLDSTTAFTVFIKDRNEAPTLLDATREVEENSPAKTPVGAQVLGTDPDVNLDQTLSYEIIGGDGAGLFEMDSCSGQISVKASNSLDYETKAEYTLIVKATDDGTNDPGPPRLSDVATVTVNILDVNEAPVVTSYTGIEIKENSPAGTSVVTVVAVDEDTNPPDVLTFRISAGNTNPAAFQGDAFKINPTTGAITVNQNVLNYESTATYVLTVEVSDNHVDKDTGVLDPLTGTGTVTIKILDVNEAPIFDPATLVQSVPENSIKDFILGAVKAVDVDAVWDHQSSLTYAVTGGSGGAFFNIVGGGVDPPAGQMSVSAAGGAPGVLNYEGPTPVFWVLVTCTDTGFVNASGGFLPNGAPQSSTANVTVRVSDVNEAPSIQDQSFKVDENVPSDTPILPVVAASDPDTRAGDQITYSIESGNTRNALGINPRTGQLFVARGGLSFDYETQNAAAPAGSPVDHKFIIEVRVSDGKLSDTASITVELQDVNEAPVWSLAAGVSVFTVTVPENSGKDSRVKVNVQATDEDANDAISYTLETTSASPLLPAGSDKFWMNATGGEVYVSAAGAAVGALNFEDVAQYRLLVRATDKGGLYTQTELVINLGDEPEAPVIVGGAPSRVVIENAQRGSVAGAPLADNVFDPDAMDRNVLGQEVFKYRILSGNHKYWQVTQTTPAVTTEVALAGDHTDATGFFAIGGGTAGTTTSGLSFTFERSVGTLTINNAQQDVNGHSEAFSFPNYFKLDVEVCDATPSGEGSGDAGGQGDAVVSGPLCVNTTVTVLVADKNVEPVLPVYASPLLVKENLALGTVVLKVLGDEEDNLQKLTYAVKPTTFFAINTVADDAESKLNKGGQKVGVGALVVAGALNYESEVPVQALTISAVDNPTNAAEALTATTVLQVQLVNVNEAPAFNAFAGVPVNPLETIRVDETTDTALGKTGQPGALVAPNTANYCIDPDTKNADINKLTYTIVSADGTPAAAFPFAIDAGTGQLSIKAGASIDYETKTSYTVTLTCADEGKDSADDTNINVLSASKTVTIQVNDVNEAPVVKSETFPPVKEGSAPGTLIGKITITDVDANTGLAQPFVWDIRDATMAQYFTVDKDGNLRVGTGSVLDFEDQDTFVVTVTVTNRHVSGVDLVVNTDMTVVVEDIDDLVLDSAETAAPVPTTGAVVVTLRGLNMGPTPRKGGRDQVVIKATYGGDDRRKYPATDCALVDGGNVAITCTLAAGVGADLKWELTVGKWTRSDSKTAIISYLPPTIAKISGATAAAMPTVGGSTVVLTGTNFGPASNDILQVRYTYGSSRSYVAICSVSKPDTHDELTCTSVAGIGNRLSWSVNVGGQISNAVAVVDGDDSVPLAYAAPSISSIQAPALLNTRGGEQVILVGANFGPFADGVNQVLYGPLEDVVNPAGGATSTRIRGRFTATTCVVQSQTRVRCLSMVGAGANHAWRITVGELPSSDDCSAAALAAGSSCAPRTSYQPPVISAVKGAGVEGGPTQGGSVFSITGDYFASSAHQSSLVVTYGPNPTTTVTTPVTVAAGAVVNGTATYNGVRYSVDGSLRLLNSDGSFVTKDTTTRTYNAKYKAACTILSQITLDCKTQAGVGKDLWFRVTLEAQATAVFDAKARYGNPVVIDYEAFKGASRTLIKQYKTRGSENVTIIGRNFGPRSEGPAAIDFVRYGMDDVADYQATTCYVSEDHVAITCLTVPGAGKDMTWLVSIASQISSSPTTAYAPPAIERFSGIGAMDASTNGGEPISIHGTNFGPPNTNYLQRVTYGTSGTEYDVTASCKVITHEQIDCLTAPGTGRDLRWHVTVRGQISLLSSATTHYALPVIDRIWPDGRTDPPEGQARQIVPTTGRVGGQPVIVTIVGSNFGAHAPYTIGVSFDGQAIAEDIKAFQNGYNDVTYACTVIDKKTFDDFVQPAPVVTREANTGVKVTTASKVVFASTLATALTLPRACIGSSLNAASAAMGKRFKIDSVTRALQRITFPLPAGEGAGRPVIVSVQGINTAVSSTEALVDYEKPRLDGITTKSRTIKGVSTYVFELNGEFFGSKPTFYVIDSKNAKAADLTATTIKVADGYLFSGLDPIWTPLTLNCNATESTDTYAECAYRYRDGEKTGALFISDSQKRTSAAQEFSVLSPLFPNALIEQQVGKRMFATRGGTILAEEALNIGDETTITVDGILCPNTAANMYLDADPTATPPVLANTVLRGKYLKKLPLADKAAFIRDVGPTVYADNDGDRTAARVECVVPPGYYQGSPNAAVDGVAVVVWNGNQPSPELRIRYNNPEIAVLESSTPPEAGVVLPPNVVRAHTNPDADGSTILTIYGDNFGNLTKVDEVCRDPDRITVDRCRSSKMCEVYTSLTAGNGTGAGVVQELCRARCGLPDCDPDSVATMPLGKVFLYWGQRLGGAGIFGRYELEDVEWGTEVTVGGQTRERIRVRVPPGVGRGLEVVLQLYNLELANARLSPPTAQESSQNTLFKVDFESPVVASVVANVDPAHPARPAEVVSGGVLNAGPTEGGHTVTITGAHFGSRTDMYQNMLPTMVDFCTQDEAQCKACKVVSVVDTQIVCTAPAWVGSNLYVRVTTGAVVSADAQYLYDGQHMQRNSKAAPASRYSYWRPTITSWTPRSAATDSRVNVTLVGHNFGSAENAVAVYVQGFDKYDSGLRPTMQPLERTHKRIVFTLPVGFGAYNEIYVVVGGQSSERRVFRYSAPQVLAVRDFYTKQLINPDCCNGPTLGGRKIIIEGASFGHYLEESRNQPVHRVFFSTWNNRGIVRNSSNPARVGGLDFPNRGYPVGWTECRNYVAPEKPADAHGRVVCDTPPGIGRDLQIRVFSGSLSEVAAFDDGVTQRKATMVAPQMSGEQISYHYDPPSVTFVDPTVPNPDGDKVRFVGTNFGSGDGTMGAAIQVNISGIACEPVEPIVQFRSISLSCTTKKAVVGSKNISIMVAEQTVKIHANHTLNLLMNPPQQFHYRVLCPINYYGQEGEYCLPCPQGGVCGWADFEKTVPVSLDEDPYREPYATVGWYDLKLPVFETDGSKNEHCHPLRTDTRVATGCPHIVPCEPKEACLGRNLCHPAYTGPRCAKCSEGHYRLNYECAPCPDNPWLLIAGFLLAAIVLCVGGYVLNRKNMHLAFLSIGVDYFQVLAMFARSRVSWPQLIKDIFTYMQIFNINLDLTAPECTIPDLSYQLKWFCVMALPLGACSILLVIHCFLWFKKRCILRRKKTAMSHWPALFGMGFTLMYYLYLYMTRTVLDIFNCSPTDPSDGYEYLSVVFERCGEPGGLQLFLLPFAAIGFVVYAVGFPATLTSLLYRNRFLIKEDQVLRAYGMGDQKSENPNAYALRKKLHKMYYHFKSDFWYWKLCILGRKFLVAFTELMFRKNVTFQLAMVLLVIIVSYALQVRFRPYMSKSDMQNEVVAHERLCADGDPVHSTIASNLAKVFADKKKERARRRMDAQRPASQVAADFFFDYNTVESTLLYALILVCVAGIMFQSGQLESGKFEAQREALTYAVLIIVFVSTSYFFAVFFSEMYITLCPQRAAAKQQEAKKKEKEEIKRRTMMVRDQNGSARGVAMMPMTPGSSRLIGKTPAELDLDMAVVSASAARSDGLGMNPMFDSGRRASPGAERMSDDLPDADTWKRVRDQLDQARKELSELKLRQQQADAALVAPAAGRGHHMLGGHMVPRRPLIKKAHAPKRAGVGTDNPLRTGSPPSASGQGTASPLPAGWETIAAPDGRVYYFNRAEQVTTWDRPT